MKHIFSILIIILFFINYPISGNAIDKNEMITEIKVLDNDTTFRYIYLYDNDGRKVLETKYFNQNNIWISLSQIEWIYQTGNCINQTERIWKNNEWLNTYKIDYSYTNAVLNLEIHSNYIDKTPKQIKKITYEYNASALISKKEYSSNSNVWTLVLQTDFKYLVQNKTDSTIITAFQSGSVVNQYLMKNFYNANGLLSSQLHQQKSNGNWVNDQLINWFYNQNSTQLLSQRIKKWISDTSFWDNFQRIDYEYNGSNNLITETYQYWKSIFWENDLRYGYYYDANGNETKKTLFKPIYHDWRGLVSVNYSYLVGNKAKLIESQYEFWGGATGEPVTSFIPFNFNDETAIQKGKYLKITYKDSTLSEPNVHGSYSSIPVYPNPSDGIFYINMQDYGIQYWIITDVNGRILKNHQQFINSGVIDLTDLPRGIYILKAITKTTQMTQKLIKN